MSETIKHWSKTVNKLVNNINVTNNNVNNIVVGVDTVGKALYSAEAGIANNAKMDVTDKNITDYLDENEVYSAIGIKVTPGANNTSIKSFDRIALFTSNPIVETTDNASITLKSTDVTVGNAETEEVCGVNIRDKNNTLTGAFRKHSLEDGSEYSEMYVSNGTTGGKGKVTVNVNPSGLVYATAPSTPSTASSNEIVTVDYLSNATVGAATKLATPRTISLSGGLTGSASFDGSSNVDINITIDGTKHSHTISSVEGLSDALVGKASINSPSFTGTPYAPTADAGTNSRQIATTAFVTTAIENQASIDEETYATKTELSNIGDSLASVATSGSYNDLTNKPTSLKNPYSLTIKNSSGSSIASYDGSETKAVTLTASSVGLGNVTNESKDTMFTSPAFTGTPTAPTATAGTNTTQVATTAFVTTAVANKTSIASATKATQDSAGNVIVDTYAPLASPALTGTPTAPTATAGTNTTQLATTAFVQNAVASGISSGADKLTTERTIILSGDATGSVDFDGSKDVTLSVIVKDDSHNHTIANVDNLETTLSTLAPLASPALTGTPTAPTAAAGTNTTQIATTAFVQNAIDSQTSTYATKTALDAKAPLASPALTGTPTAPTATAGTNTTQLATTAFVTNAVSGKANDSDVVKLSGNQTIAGTKTFSSTISGSINGNAATATKATQDASGNVITSTYATKTALDAKAPLASPALTGTPTAPTATAGTNTTQIATTAFVTTAVANKTSVAKLSTARTIDGVSFDGSANILHYGTCSTAAATAAKTVALTGFTLDTGSRVMVKFTVTNTAANPTLNVNSTGAKSIMYRGASITAGYLAANRVYEFVYDGTNYELVGDINTDTNNKVTQTITTTNAEYALLAMADASATATKTNGARFASAVTLNPSSGTITATKFKGALDGNASTATTASSCSGNAATATTASSCSGNAATATKLAASKNIALTGDVTGSAGFDGSAAASIAATLANSGVTAGSYGTSANATPAFGGTFSVPYITVDAKGRATAASTKTITIPALDMSNATAGTLAVARGGTGLTASPSMLINLASTTAANVLAASPRPGVTGVLPVANGGTGSSTKNFVDLSSAQTITGGKTFGANIIVKQNIYSDVTTNRLHISGGTNWDKGALLYLDGIDHDDGYGTKGGFALTARNDTSSATLGGNPNGALTWSGTFTATAVYNAVWNDYAEFFPRGEETEAGDFVALSLDSDNEVYVKASKETSKSVGIHSDSFGHLIGGEQAPEGQDFVEYNLPKYIPVGLVGRVRANIVGEVKKGDFIVISDIPGVGRTFNKETDSYVDIIGMACESSSEKDIKRIKVKLGN